MANTFITNTSNFRPFSFQEMLQPYQIYIEAYNQADAELNTLLEDAATKGFNFAPQDVEEATAYNNIIDRIKSASDQLASGLNPQLSKEINQINKDYRKVMLPIQQKLNKRAELAAEQRELLSKNSNLRFTKDYSTESLGNITSSSTYDVIDLDNLYKTTAQEFASKTSTLYRDDIEPTPIGNTGYYNVTTGYGYTPEEFAEGFTNKDSDVYKFYKNKVNEIDSRTDISPSIKNEMKAAVLRGMEASSGTFKTSQVKGRFADAPTSKMLKIGENLYELSGALYQYDEDGNLYKVGNKPTSKSTSSSSSSASGGNSDKKRIGRPDQPISIKFNKKGEVISTEAVDLEIVKNLGQLKNYSELLDIEGINMQTEIGKYIGEDDPSNYNYYVNGREVIPVPKKITITESETSNVDTEVE